MIESFVTCHLQEKLLILGYKILFDEIMNHFETYMSIIGMER